MKHSKYVGLVRTFEDYSMNDRLHASTPLESNITCYSLVDAVI